MPSKKILIAMLAVAAVAVIAWVWVGRRSPAPQPPASQQPSGQPIAEETAAQPVQKPPASAQGLAAQPASMPLPPAAGVAPLENGVAPLTAGDTARLPLKALESAELPVDWEKALAHPQLDPSLLSPQQEESISQAQVPVLLPDSQPLLPAARISGGPGWYAASIKQEGLAVMISGESKVALVPGSEAAEPPEWGAHEAWLNRAEGMVEVSFKAFGIYYNVVMECRDHEKDPRCGEDEFVMELVNGLKLARPGDD